MEITIDTTHTSKRLVNICRRNDNGSLTIIETKKLIVTTDFAAGTETTSYKGNSYSVEGTIYLSYIVVA